MNPDDDLNPTQWAAVVALLLMLLVPVAVALAAFFKRRYAAAIVRLQASTAAAGEAPALPSSSGGATPEALHIDVVPAREAAAQHGPDPTAPSRRLRRRVLGWQFASGLLYWWALLLCLLIALVHLAQVTGEAVETSDDGATIGGHLFLWPLLVLPAALAWALQAGLRESRLWSLAALTMALFGLGIVDLGAGWAGGGALLAVCVMLTLMMVAFMRPAVRGAGPPLVAALTVGLIVFSVLLALLVALDDSGADAPVAGADIALALLAIALLGLPSGWAAWRMLMRLARRYEARRFSEMQLALGAYWALITVFTAGFALLLSFEGRTGASMEWVALAIALLWIGWRWAQRGVLRLVQRRSPAPLGALLMLRVFKPSNRSEGFTDRFLARWRFAAPVWMIAGPDLAGAYMEPDEFFAYLRGHLRERFIARPDDVDARTAGLDDRRDPDGRFRVHELFCANSSWRHAVLALIDRAGVVLLDLREYSRHRAGTRFELETLLRRGKLDRLVVIADERDHLPSLEHELRAVWSEVAPPGAGGRLRLLTLGSGSDAEMQGLFRAVAAAATTNPTR